MDNLEMLKSLAIVIVSAKLFGLLAKKINMPQVVGQIVAGIVIGPCLINLVQPTDIISAFAEIGVILLMFSAGLDTNLEELKKCGFKAFVIATCGVVVPLVMGAVLYGAMYGFGAVGSKQFLKAVFIGVILTATSVSITIQTLKELGKLKTEIGTTIMSAAVIDDIIGIIVLTLVLGVDDGNTNIMFTCLKIVGFFVLAFVLGELIYKLFKYLSRKSPQTQRTPIFSLALCLFMSWAAEKFFGIADITGAYIAGVILCNLKESDYIIKKVDVSSYMIFGPIFFVSIGLMTTFDGLNLELIIFSLLFVVVAFISKLVGCGVPALCFKYNFKDSMKIGAGMLTRGEVALIVAQKGLNAGLVSATMFTPIIIMIVVTSVIPPIILKALYKSETSQAQDKLNQISSTNKE